MKNIKSLLIFAILFLSIFCLSGCSSSKITTIDTVLTMNQYYSGSRTMTCTFPKTVVTQGSESEKQLDFIIDKNCPKDLTYKKFSDTSSISYIFNLEFSSKEEYFKKLQNILGDNYTSSFSKSDTIFTKGNMGYENFSSSSILEFISKSIDNHKDLGNLKLNLTCRNTSVIFDQKTYYTDPKIDFNDMEYNPIDNISIETKSNDDSTYNRTFIFSIPNDTMKKLGESIYIYMDSRISRSDSETYWTNHGGYQEYKIIYNNINLEQLNKFTAMLFNSPHKDNINHYPENVSILKKQNIFSEYIDTSAYLTYSGNPVPVRYNYSCSKNINLDSVYREFDWYNILYASENTFSTMISNPSVNINISEVTPILPECISIDLIVEGNGNFSRNIQLKYSKNNTDAIEYVNSFSKNINRFKGYFDSTTDNLIYYIFCSGNADELDKNIQEIFGTENNISYELNENKFSTHNRILFNDNIHFKNTLPEACPDIPITYNIYENHKEDISELYYIENSHKTNVDLAHHNTSDYNETQIFTKSSNVDINYTARSANLFGITFVISIFGLFLIILFIIVILVNHNTRNKSTKTKNKKLILSKDDNKNHSDIDNILSDI